MLAKKNSIRLIAIDLDGTLLNENGKIAESDKKSLVSVAKSNITILLATGRSYYSTLQIIRSLPIPTYIALHNGAQILNPYGKEICRATIETYNLKKAIRIIKCLDLHPIIYREKKGEIIITVEKSALSENVILNYLSSKWHITDIVNDITELNNTQVFELLCFGTYPVINNTNQKINNLSNKITNWLSPWIDETYILEIVSSLGTKKTALSIIANQLKINASNILAIGDNNNDIGMLNYAGISVAMGNATENVKKIADFVTLTNKKAGVSYAINLFVRSENI